MRQFQSHRWAFVTAGLSTLLVFAACREDVPTAREIRAVDEQTAIEALGIREGTPPLPEDQAVAMARLFAEQEDLLYSSDYRLESRRGPGYWAVMFLFLPETPGLWVTVLVLDDGRYLTVPGM